MQQAVLDAVGRRWGIEPSSLTLLRDGLNHVYRGHTHTGAKRIVRVTDGGHRTAHQIESELAWVEFLADHEAAVARPFRSMEKHLVETVEADEGTRHVSVFKDLGGSATWPSADPGWNLERWTRLGAAIGRMHRVNDHYHPRQGLRHGLWFEDRETVIRSEEVEGLDEGVEAAMRAHDERMIAARPTREGHWGLIHRDLHCGNVLIRDEHVFLVDFELGCYGWRLEDLTVGLYNHFLFPSLKIPGADLESIHAYLRAFLAGYEREHPFDRAQLERMSDVLLIREIFIYRLMKPRIDYWQTAIGSPSPHLRESIEWIERRWRTGDPSFELELERL